MTTVAWILNLDADLELADPDAFRASHRQQARAAEWGERFLAHARAHSSTTHTALRTVPGSSCRDSDAAVLCQAFSPTPRAHTIATRAGLELPDSPPFDVLRHVNDRTFAAALGGELPGRAIVRSVAELETATSRGEAPNGWLLKRLFGFSGRGQKRITSAPVGPERRWIDGALAAHGALLAEPFVVIVAEFVLHGWLRKDGSAWFGDPATQRHDDRGAWQDTTRGAADLTPEELDALATAGTTVARELHAAGYFGPFAIDAYRWEDAGGPRFEPLGELNARYTMGWFAGIGDRQDRWLGELTGDPGTNPQ